MDIPGGTAGDTPTSPSPAPSPRRGIPLAGLVLGIGVLIGGAAGFVLAKNAGRNEPRELLTARVERPVERLSTERQIALQRLASLGAEAVDPLAEPTVVMEGFLAQLRLSPPYEAIDSAVFDAGDVRVRLGRVTPVGRSEVCWDANTMRFACGLMGRAALMNLLGQNTVICDRLFASSARATDRVVADCRTDKGVIVEDLVRAGFALPNDLGGNDLTGELTEAIRRRAGIWAGPYVGPPIDPAEEDMRQVPPAGPRIVAPPDPDTALPIAPPPPKPATTVEAPAKTKKPRRNAAPLAVANPAPPPPAPTEAARPLPTPPRAAATEGGRPSLETLAPKAKGGDPKGGVVAGPILPPPPALAEKLGIPAGSGDDTGAPVRNSSSDR